MLKKALILLLIILAVTVTVVFLSRYRIFQYSAESIIRSSLPDYVKIDAINFDLRGSKVVLDGFKIVNPPNFSHRYLIEIDKIVCEYRMRGKGILDGIEILAPQFSRPLLTIERLNNGNLNLTGMQKILETGTPKKEWGRGAATGPVQPGKEGFYTRFIGKRKVSDLVKLPQDFQLKDGKIIFLDRFKVARPHTITFENVDAQLSLKLNDSYTRVLNVSSKGTGNLSGRADETVRWTIGFNPATARLTMSNRFEVSGLDILTFEPYYDAYSPFIFKGGKFSGTMVFDFDNGNIGSTNEIRLSDFLFYIKGGYESAQLWQTTVPELARYLTTSTGEIVFDFKIKGDMANPRFYLGPITKHAIASMAIEKISDAIQKTSGQPSSGGPSSDVEKVKGYIDLFQDLIKKK